jgi:dihydrofolate reductase
LHISLIAAIGQNNEIGLDNKLLWNIKEDMDWFRKHTKHKVVVMGRKTYESIGKPLKGRVNVVLTRNPNYNPHPDVLVRKDISEITFEFRNELEVMVIGGETIYKQFMPFANRLYITHVNHEFKADSFFPDFDTEDVWTRYFYQEGSENSEYDYSFSVYKRKLNIEGMRKNVCP